MAGLAGARRMPRRWGWTETALVGIVATNLGTTVLPLVDDSYSPGPWLITSALASWVVLLFTFPDGRPAPGFTRWVLGASLALIAAPSLPGVSDVFRVAGFGSAFAVGLVTQVWRYQRRSTVAERQATKWLLVGLVPAGTVFLGVGLVVATTSLEPGILEARWYIVASFAAIWLVPIAAAVGLTVGDRGPIQQLVETVIVVCGVGVAVAWGYFLAVPMVGEMWAAVIAVLLVVPVRRLVQRLGTDIAVGRAARSAISTLGRRLETSVSPTDVCEVVTSAVFEGLMLSYAAVVLDGETVSSAGSLPAAGVMRFPVTYLGSMVGEIHVAPRPGDVALSHRDRAALVHLAAAAGPALHGARTLQELSIARERLVLTREEERRRLRRDLHDDLAPTLAGLGLRAAAAASLSPIDGDRAQRAHADLQAGIQAAISQVRDIAHDLRPPVLDDHGLEAAIRARLATDVDPDLVVNIEFADLPPIPAAVELAVLRIVQEAVTNVRRHAGARTCRVGVTEHDGLVHLVVADDGQGIPSNHHRGVGLESIGERVEELGGSWSVTTPPEGGTRVTATLPSWIGVTW